MSWVAAPADEVRSSVTLGLAFTRTHDQQSHLAGSLLLNLPTAKWLGSPRRAKSAAAPERPAPDTEANPAVEEIEICAEAAPAAEDAKPRPRAPLPSIRTLDVRAAIRAALRRSGLATRHSRLDDLASRARWSAALPELRLRVTRLIDESAALSPTSYDAERRTERGGASLWLEARTTWHLDRALFSSEEIRLERLRYKSSADRRQASREVLALLFEWQRAAATLIDLSPEATPTECRAAQLAEQQLALEIDLLTGGWFQQWTGRKAERRPSVSCEQP